VVSDLGRAVRRDGAGAHIQRLAAVMSQTRLGSFVEAHANIAIGFSINYVANLLVFPVFGMHISLRDNFFMGCIYTLISVVRSYAIRRWFNGLTFGNKETAK
jgi:hypothetical protein